MSDATAPVPDQITGNRSGMPPRWAGIEVVLVLAVSLGQSAIYSILSIIDRVTRQQALNQQASQLNTSVTPDRPWLDLSYQLVNIIFPLVPVLLALYLLALHNPYGERRSWRVIGFDLRRPGFDLGLGALTALCIGVPGLGLYLGARALGLNTQVQAANLADNWWTIPVLIIAAAQNAILEETIMIGFLYTRFRQLNWAWPVIIIVSAVIRGSYHLYQGFGGFAGNLIMGVIFGLIYLKWKRVMPLVVTHTLLDIAAFVGYWLLAPHLSWLK
ncbi:CPBP family intramembrane glutamic endopeptidase [Microlunatus elymi]|nr:CPBP family intramembrane glutamic endopeptidase [Microlunatus elymi]